MAEKHKSLKHKFEKELDYIESLGSKIFLINYEGNKIKRIGFNVISFLVLFTTAQLFFTLCLTGFNDWMEIINIAPNIGVAAMSTIKYMKIRSNRELYDKLFTHFRGDIWDVIQEYKLVNEKMVTKYLSIAKFINRFMVYYSIPLVLAVDSFPWLIMNYQTRILGLELHHLYPFDAWYPFNKVKFYYVAYAWESFMTGVVICIYAYSNIINISYIVFICMELRLLGNSIVNLITDEDASNIIKRNNVDQIHWNIRNKLRKIIKRHEYLMKTANDLDLVLGDVMLLSYTFGAVFICLTAFSFTVVTDMYQSIRYFSFFVSLLCETFDQCIIGQVLSDHSEDLSEAIYNANWPMADAICKRTLLMFLMRTQKPFVLTTHGYIVMNLNTFCKICSSSYQFFNLLHTIYND